jgi:hypothetical protein
VTTKLIWRKRCDSGACVEIAVQDEAVMMRNSQVPEAIVTFTRAEWREFLGQAKQGLFDDC